MALDPSIILGANRFDPIGAMSRGATAANQQNAFARQTAYDQAVTQNGAAALRGDETAQNALAGFDPGMVQGLQSNALGMQAQRQSMDIQRDDFAMRREEAKAKAAAAIEAKRGEIDMAKAAEDAARTRDLLVRAGRFQSQGDETGYNLFLQQNGVDPREYPMAEYRYIAATVEGVLDAVDAAAGTSNSGDRFKVVGSQLVDVQAEGGPKAVITAPGQEEVVFGPDGKPILSRGPVGSAAKFTEAQSKDIVYSTRARGALNDLEGGNPSALSSRYDTILDSIPLGLGREVQSPEYQQAQTAGNEFLQAVLRKDTGAAITEQEQQLYGQTYLPQPGDGPERLAQKKAARERALLAMEAGMSPEAILRQEQALSTPGAQPAPTNPRRIEQDGFVIEALD